MSWHDDAACRGMNPNIFHPEGGNGWATARRVCSGCTVRRDCLSAAFDEERRLGRHNWHGMRGGRTPEERAALLGLRPRKKAAA